MQVIQLAKARGILIRIKIVFKNLLINIRMGLMSQEIGK